MGARITIDRILRDDDDASGQSIRKWMILAEPGIITIKMNHGEGFIILRPSDIQVLAEDLQRAKDAELSLSSGKQTQP